MDYPIRYYKKSHHYSEDMVAWRDREAFALILESGAVEGWRSKVIQPNELSPDGYFGGVEIHSRNPLYADQEPTPGNCDLLNGGTCYHDGSSMAYDRIAPYFDTPRFMFEVLATWEPAEWKEKVS